MLPSTQTLDSFRLRYRNIFAVCSPHDDARIKKTVFSNFKCMDFSSYHMYFCRSLQSTNVTKNNYHKATVLHFSLSIINQYLSDLFAIYSLFFYIIFIFLTMSLVFIDFSSFIQITSSLSFVTVILPLFSQYQVYFSFVYEKSFSIISEHSTIRLITTRYYSVLI